MKILTNQVTGVALGLIGSILFFANVLAAAEPIKIAVGGPHTGSYAAFGEQMLRGALKAAEDINAKGGIEGKKIEIVKVDDECKPMVAVNAANDIVSKYKANAVVGHFCSSSTIPASKTYWEYDTLMITPASTNPEVTERKLDNVLRMCGRDDQQGVVAANFVADELSAKRIAILHDKTTYGLGLAKAFQEALGKTKSKPKEVLFEGITRGERDFSTLVTKIRADKADVVYFGGLHSEAGPLLKQMRDQGLKADFVSGDGIVSKDFVTAAGGGKYVEGVYVTFGSDPRNLEESKTVVASFLKEGKEPEGYTLYSYASVQAIAAAIEAVDDNDRSGKKLADWLKAHEVKTVMGPKAWNQAGDLKTSDYVIYRWDANGNYQEYQAKK